VSSSFQRFAAALRPFSFVSSLESEPVPFLLPSPLHPFSFESGFEQSSSRDSFRSPLFLCNCPPGFFFLSLFGPEHETLERPMFPNTELAVFEYYHDPLSPTCNFSTVIPHTIFEEKFSLRTLRSLSVAPIPPLPSYSLFSCSALDRSFSRVPLLPSSVTDSTSLK